jgi:hypothetical protein
MTPYNNFILDIFVTQICPPEYFKKIFEMKETGIINNNGVKAIIEHYLKDAKKFGDILIQMYKDKEIFINQNGILDIKV